MKDLKLEVKRLERIDLKQVPVPSPTPTSPATEQTINMVCDVGENIFSLCGGITGT